MTKEGMQRTYEFGSWNHSIFVIRYSAVRFFLYLFSVFHLPTSFSLCPLTDILHFWFPLDNLNMIR
jgi:hypothetical protein